MVFIIFPPHWPTCRDLLHDILLLAGYKLEECGGANVIWRVRADTEMLLGRVPYMQIIEAEGC